MEIECGLGYDAQVTLSKQAQRIGGDGKKKIGCKQIEKRFHNCKQMEKIKAKIKNNMN
jgi:hypothetical protein